MKKMSDREFNLFSKMIYSNVGIKMPPAKKLMLSSRLSRRLRICGIDSFKEYYDYISGPDGGNGEYHMMIDAVTTNKTEFFREPVHFDFLKKTALPALIETRRFRARKKLFVWSAGCSTGEEAYTLAIVLSEFFSGRQGEDFSILATDISTEVLSKSIQAIYTEEKIKPVSPILKKKYLMRGTSEQKGKCRIVPELRKKVKVKKLNFLDNEFGVQNDMDIIFCRNVVIYFDRPTQVDFFNKLYRHIVPGGYLFIGSSETLFGINDKFVSVGPTVYRKPE